MTKGLETRDAVLREALVQSSRVGLRGITIGSLSDSMGMSKSGLFAHFRSKEQLQLDTLGYATDSFALNVVQVALKAPRGEPRVQVLFERWLGWAGYADYAMPGGCIFATAAREFDDEPDGPVRDALVQGQLDWRDSVETIFRSGIAEGHFRDDANPREFAADLLGILLSYQFSARLLGERDAASERAGRAFERLLDSVRT
ncbi:TetR/AcrR family transcriptional regulator [Knoellia sp. CPCC 206453]